MFYAYSSNVDQYPLANSRNLIGSPSYGLRPVVSLKPGTPVVRGSGTVEDPYVIE